MGRHAKTTPAERFEKVSSGACVVYGDLVEQLKAVQPHLAAGLAMAPSKTAQVLALTAAEREQRTRYVERTWERVVWLDPREPPPGDIAELLSWLAPLRAAAAPADAQHTALHLDLQAEAAEVAWLEGKAPVPNAVAPAPLHRLYQTPLDPPYPGVRY